MILLFVVSALTTLIILPHHQSTNLNHIKSFNCIHWLKVVLPQICDREVNQIRNTKFINVFFFFHLWFEFIFISF